MTTTQTKNKHLDDLHFEHLLWNSEIKFYTDELKVYQQQLEKIVRNSVDDEEKKQIERFQNKFIVQEERLNDLINDINVHEQWLVEYAMENPTGIAEEMFADHKLMREKVGSFHRIHSELKNEFRKFLVHRIELVHK